MDLTPNSKKGGRGGAHPGGKDAAQKAGNRGDTSGTAAKGVQQRTANRGPNVKKGGGRRKPRLTAKPTGQVWNGNIVNEDVITTDNKDK